MNAGQIIEGWSNYFKSKFNALDPKLKNLSELRLQICAECPVRTGSLCDPMKKGIHLESGFEERGCGCHLSAKSMSTSASCPLGKW
jgi:hypothetical protein